jgi:hypothetical protein
MSGVRLSRSRRPHDAASNLDADMPVPLGQLTSVSELSAPAGQLSFEHSPMASVTLTATARQMPAMQQYTTL